MRIIKKPNDESKYPLAKCEHCGRIDEAPLDKSIQDVVCKRCGMTTDKD